MRPTKLTSNLLEAFRAVLADELAAIAFTEEELVWQANQRLQPEHRISYRTYQRYKTFFETQDNGCQTQDTRHKTQEQGIDNEGNKVDTANAELVENMYNTFKGALMQQKLALVRGIYEGQPNWRRYSWMLERKFPDFKMKTITPANTKPADAKPVAEVKPALTDGQPERLKAAQKVPERMEDKWQHYIPMKPFEANHHWTLNADILYSVEESIARYESLGMENPYKHLGYQEDELRDGGQYRFYGMGPDKLPLRQYCPPGGTFPTLTAQELERLWAIQEADNQRAKAA